MKQIHKVPLSSNIPPVHHPTNGTIATSQSSPEVNHLPTWVLLPLRLFLGITFVYAGIQKLGDPQYFDPSATGYIGKQIQAFATGSPLHNFLIYVAVPHANLFGALVAIGELAIGVATLLGLLARPAAFFGMLLSIVFFLSASWHVYPYFYGADIVFAFCWLTLLITGPVTTWIPAYDTLLLPRLLENRPLQKRARLARVLNLLLGLRMPGPAAINQLQGGPAASNRSATYKGRQVPKRPGETRRTFLWGLVSGSAATLAIAWLIQNFHVLPQTSTDTAPADQPPTAPSNSTPVSSTPANSNTIAQVSAVPANSAVDFTIPSNGDPGVLIHLNNGKFVAFDATCTHAGCPVQYDSHSQHLICPCHGAEFDPANAAAVVQGPTNTPLQAVPIQVDNATGTISLSN